MNVMTEHVTEIIFEPSPVTEIDFVSTEINRLLTSNLTEFDGATTEVDVVTDGPLPLRGVRPPSGRHFPASRHPGGSHD